MMTLEPVAAVFRKYPDGDIIALFPAEAATYDGVHCVSYAHIGQHCAADYSGVIAATKPAKPHEYRELRAELEQVGYIVRAVRRATYKHHELRRQAAKEQR